VAVARPLKLKAEVFRTRTPASESVGIARVWVDSGVYHLDGEFDYAIPAKFGSVVEVGVRIVVPFGNRECEALVISRMPGKAQGGVKEITKVLSPIAVATAESLALIAEVSRRWAAHPYDVLRSAIPPRSAAVDKEPVLSEKGEPSTGKLSRKYLQFPPAQDSYRLIAEYVAARRGSGSLLVLLPDSRSIERLQEFLSDVTVLDSNLDKSDRYRNYLKTLRQGELVVLGTRNSVFAPLSDLREIILVDDSSESYYEQRSPGWNARDVATLRSQMGSISFTIMGYSPSAEVARLIETGWMKYQPVKASLPVKSFHSTSGELLPTGIFSPIRSALKNGPVLFIAPRKGYSQSILCTQCRNVSLCECGGRVLQRGAGRVIECSICQKSYPDWSCAWCQSQKFFLMGRGSERFAQEIGRAFPGFAVTESSGERILDKYLLNDGIVISTPGAIPKSPEGYSAVVILECERLFSQADVRSQERARGILFSSAGSLASGSQLLLVISHNHPVLSALAAWKPSLITSKELRDREEVGFPPFTRSLSLEIEASEAPALVRGLKSAQSAGRLPISTRILGPSPAPSGKSRLLLLVPVEEGEEMVLLIHEFQRKRSISKKSLASLRIDPYSLSQ
jgi:primosomal protein N' (replication factor Y)